MDGEEKGLLRLAPAPGVSPPYLHKGCHWAHFDKSATAIWFGCLATAILIALFLVVAIFKKFLRTNPPEDYSMTGGRRRPPDNESIGDVSAKLVYPSPTIRVVSEREVSVVMAGDNAPTFLAHPAPLPCHTERISLPSHQQQSLHV